MIRIKRSNRFHVERAKRFVALIIRRRRPPFRNASNTVFDYRRNPAKRFGI